MNEELKEFVQRKKNYTIPFNIWDDFCDDLSAPESWIPKKDIQRTHGYIEDYDLNEDQKNAIAKHIFSIIKNIQESKGLVFCADLEGEDIIFTQLTHEELGKLMHELDAQNYDYEGIPISFYSES